MIKLDARGISCPEPVMMARNAVLGGRKNIEIFVDNGAPKNNVTRFLKNSHYSVEIKDADDGLLIVGSKK